MIEGFPNTLDEALFFEQNVFPIETFINFKADCETCYKRIQEKEKDLENKTSIDDFKNTYDDYSRNINKLIENNCVIVYDTLKDNKVKEKDIANALLTMVIKSKKISKKM